MDEPQGGPPILTPESAWQQSRQIGDLARLDASVLVLALAYACTIGAARNAVGFLDCSDAEHVAAARLYIALQLRLRRHGRQALAGMPDGELERLTQDLPFSWRATLAALLDRDEEVPSPPHGGKPMSASGARPRPDDAIDAQAA